MDKIASGLSLTNTNYKQALDVFFENIAKITNSLMRIHKLLFPYNYSCRIQTFLWQNWVCIRGLESLGTDESRYGKIRTPMIYNKLPAEVRKNITSDKGDNN